MRKLVAPAATLLASCSQPAEQDPAPGPSNATDQLERKAPVIEPSGNTPSPTTSGSKLSGTVRGLSGSITGLSTRVTEFGTYVDLSTDVLFDFDSDVLKAAADQQLRKTAELIGRASAARIEITGHTDSIGSDRYNLDLSNRRAKAVLAWLTTEGRLDPARLSASGRGEAEPVAPNALPDGGDNPEGRQRNRRVQIFIPK